MKPTIDAEFAALCPPLTAEEYAALESSIVAEGCRDALIVWQGLLVDGHHRLRICEKHQKPFDTLEVNLADRDAVKTWIIKNQFARRNLTNMQRSELALELEPLLAARAKQRQIAGGKSKIPQKSAEAETRDQVASLAGVSHDTIAKAKVLKERASEDVKASLRRGDTTISREYEVLTGKAHVSHATGENEWYTPPEYIEAARKVLGAIDCDPASSEIANRTVGAAKFYTRADEGQSQKWGKRVWMNPPYGQPLVSEFSRSLCNKLDSGEVKEACVLVNNATETEWLQSMLARMDAACFIRGRISYLNPAGVPAEKPLQGQVVLYFGPHVTAFTETFREKGIVLRR